MSVATGSSASVYGICAGLLGLLSGSFLNVLIWRLPRGESVVLPGSHCTGCGALVKPYDNLPVISWLLLRGKCRNCASSISARYPAVELLTAALATAVVLSQHSLQHIVLGELLVLTVVPVAFIDFDHRIIPNAILAPAAVAAVIGGGLTRPGGLPTQLIAGAAAAGFLLVFALAYPRGLGMGDVKFAGVLGLFLGSSVAVAILIALVAGVVIGIGLMAEQGVAQGRKLAIPFGPFLALGAVAAIFCGSPILHWYLHTVI